MKNFKVVLLTVLTCLLANVLYANPPVTDGLVVQFNAKDLVLNDGEPVAAWADTVNDFDAVQPAADSQPIYVASVEEFGFRPVVRFDGTNDWLNLPSDPDAPINVGSVTVITYAKFNVVDEGVNGSGYIIAGQDGSGNDRIRIAYDSRINSEAGGFEFRIGNSGWAAIDDPDYDTEVHTFAITSTAEGFVDGVSTGTSANTSTEQPDAFNLGSYNQGEKDFFNGEIAELLIYDRVLTQEEITAIGEYFISGGIVTNPTPNNNATLIPVETSSLSWDTPEVDFTPSKYVLTIRADDPNFADTANNTVVDPVVDLDAGPDRVEAAMPVTLEYGRKYHWLVDVYDGTNVYSGDFNFTVIPLDKTPVISVGNSNFITWLDNLPQGLSATVNDYGEGDIDDVDVEWSIVGYPGDQVDAVAQLIDRGMTSANALELKDAGFDPNMFAEWIGTDTRTGIDPLVLTISGLPAGSYTWTSFHHDYDDQTGLFDVYVNGVLAGSDIDISEGNEIPTEFTTAIVTDGSDLVIIFDKQAYDSDSSSFFIMNAFELSDGVNSLKVDFDNDTSGTMPGYESYVAAHEDLTTFTAQSFAFGAGAVAVLPEWGPNIAGWITASVAKTSTDPLAPAANLDTNYPGLYTIQLYLEDGAGQSDDVTMQVNAAANACEAAQLSDSWSDFNYFDTDENCVVDLNDFADFAAVWLENLSAVDVEAY